MNSPMLAVTHLVLALVLISALKLDRNTAFAVLLFGVFIDLDHTFGLVEFVVREGLGNSLDYKAAMASNIQWKSMFHSPEAAVLVLPLSVSYRYAMPFIAWGAHLSMDYVQINYLGVMSGFEFYFLAVLVAVLVCSELQERRKIVPGASVRSLMTWEAERARTWLADLPIVWRIITYLRPRGSSA